MLEITIQRDGEFAATIVADGPKPPNRSLYGSGWDRFSVRYRLGDRLLFEDDIHARPEDGYLGFLMRIGNFVRQHPEVLASRASWRDAAGEVK